MSKSELPALTLPRPFMYGIRTPDGAAHMDECCVHTDPAALESVHVPALNETLEEGEGEYEVVPLYTAEQVEAMLAGRQ